MDLDTIWMCVSFLENGMLRFRVELLAVVQRDHGVADRAADRVITVSSQTSAPSRIRSIRPGIAIGPSTAV